MILDFQSKFDTSVTYYGLGFIWTNTGGLGGGAAAVSTPLRTLLGVGL